MKIMVKHGEYHGLFLWGFLIILCTISLLYKIWLKIPIRGPLHLPLLEILNKILYNKLIAQSTIKNSHKNKP